MHTESIQLISLFVVLMHWLHFVMHHWNSLLISFILCAQDESADSHFSLERVMEARFSCLTLIFVRYYLIVLNVIEKRKKDGKLKRAQALEVCLLLHARMCVLVCLLCLKYCKQSTHLTGGISAVDAISWRSKVSLSLQQQCSHSSQGTKFRQVQWKANGLLLMYVCSDAVDFEVIVLILFGTVCDAHSLVPIKRVLMYLKRATLCALQWAVSVCFF